MVYVAGGACDITVKDCVSKEVSFKWDAPNSLEKHLLDSLRREDKFMAENHPAGKIVFCTLIGTELSQIVTDRMVHPGEQTMVNNAVFSFNTEIFAVNKRRGTFSPSLHRAVHRSTRGAKKSFYEHLHDGIHPGESLKEKWAEEFVKAVGAN